MWYVFSDMECVNCRKPNATLQCECCEEPTCKKCVEFLAPDAFQFRVEVPEELKHSRYCGQCFDLHVAPELSLYEETLEQAKRVFVFFKTQRKSIPLIKKEKNPEWIEESPDRDETILKLAYISASRGFNAIMDVETTSKKVRNEAYQTSVWSGSGIPAQVDAARVHDQDLAEEIYR